MNEIILPCCSTRATDSGSAKIVVCGWCGKVLGYDSAGDLQVLTEHQWQLMEEEVQRMVFFFRHLIEFRNQWLLTD